MTATRVGAVNQLIAAACAMVDAPFTGQAYDAVAERLKTAVTDYRAVRTDIDAARDVFLAQYPEPEMMGAAVERLIGQADRTLYGKAADSVRYDGDGLGDSAAPARDSWVSPGGSLCCPWHIDGCPPGDDPRRAWHRLVVRGLAGPDDPEAGCMAHTGNASNRCMLRANHPGGHDDLSGPTPV